MATSKVSIAWLCFGLCHVYALKIFVLQPSELREELAQGVSGDFAETSLESRLVGRLMGTVEDLSESCETHEHAELALITSGRCSMQSQAETTKAFGWIAGLASKEMLAYLQEETKLGIIVLPSQVIDRLHHFAAISEVVIEIILEGTTEESSVKAFRPDGNECGPACLKSRSLRASTGGGGGGGSSGGSHFSGFSSGSSFRGSNKCTSNDCAIGVGLSIGAVFLATYFSLRCGVLLFFYVRKRLRRRREIRNAQLATVGLLPEKFSSGHVVYNFSECSICMTDFQVGVPVKITLCDHIFHDKCFDDWIKTCVMNPRCPECNKNPFIRIPGRRRVMLPLESAMPHMNQPYNSIGELKETPA